MYIFYRVLHRTINEFSLHWLMHSQLCFTQVTAFAWNKSCAALAASGLRQRTLYFELFIVLWTLESVAPSIQCALPIYTVNWATLGRYHTHWCESCHSFIPRSNQLTNHNQVSFWGSHSALLGFSASLHAISFEDHQTSLQIIPVLCVQLSL